MFRWLVVLMVVIPAVEILVLILMGSWIGGWATFLLILATGFLGAFLAKSEARKVWSYAKYELAENRMPGESLIDGICIFSGGLLLLTPGFLTDAMGFLLVVPWSRKYFRAFIIAMIKRMAANGRIMFFR